MRDSSSSADHDRGGRWVAAQFVLIALAVVAAWLPPGWPESIQVPLVGLGAALCLLGVLLGVWSVRTLGSAATPYPRPAEKGRLVETGPYAYVRHPIYAAGVLFLTGLGLATSPAVFLPLAALAILWRNKAALEEDWLEERYPEYREYRGRVGGSFLPTRSRRAG